MITYDLLEPSEDLNASLDSLSKRFAPLHSESWAKNKAAAYDRPYDVNVGVLSAMWMDKSLRIFMAYDDGKPVGYLTGIVFRPIPYRASVFQVEDWYARGNEDIEDGLFSYLRGVLRILGCDELWVAQGTSERLPQIPAGWRRANAFIHYRYVKE